MSGRGRSARAAHLTRRFFGSLRPGGVAAADTAWVASVLEPAELQLWNRLGRADRREAIAVARRTQQALAGSEHAGDTRWLAAALLHDVGKLDAGLGTYGRAVATVAGSLFGRAYASAWSESRGFTRKVGLYLRHAELGAQRIRVAGGRAEVAQWAEAHHTPASWSGLEIPPAVSAALAAADGEPVGEAR